MKVYSDYICRERDQLSEAYAQMQSREAAYTKAVQLQEQAVLDRADLEVAEHHAKIMSEARVELEVERARHGAQYQEYHIQMTDFHERAQEEINTYRNSNHELRTSYQQEANINQSLRANNENIWNNLDTQS